MSEDHSDRQAGRRVGREKRTTHTRRGEEGQRSRGDSKPSLPPHELINAFSHSLTHPSTHKRTQKKVKRHHGVTNRRRRIDGSNAVAPQLNFPTPPFQVKKKTNSTRP
mmetsp:Transcript_31498/g.62245  ORF Transcript_31498/g.62245 Transcript_31498/m.62245 type:complete len:108 (-) Transcript_31498:455-778(-)